MIQHLWGFFDSLWESKMLKISLSFFSAPLSVFVLLFLQKPDSSKHVRQINQTISKIASFWQRLRMRVKRTTRFASKADAIVVAMEEWRAQYGALIF
jgi:hypothetical protein